MTAEPTPADIAAERDAEWWSGDDYPGPAYTPPTSRWDETGCCTHCGHTKDEHGEKKCGLNLIAGIFCRCPIGRGAA